LWDRANRVQGVVSEPRSASPGLLTGILRCAGCCYTLKADTNTSKGRRYDIYRCKQQATAGKCSEPASITRARADAMVEDAFLRMLGHEAAAPSEAANTRLRDAERERDEAIFELEAFSRETRASSLPPGAYAAGLEERHQDVLRADERVREEAGPVDARRRLPEPQSIRESWRSLPLQARREMIAAAYPAVMLRRGSGSAESRLHIISAGRVPSYFPVQGKHGHAPRGFDWPE
jgi:site-specific DNA recombinase